MALVLNPDISDAYESKTLAQMRAMVHGSLGFIDALRYAAAQRTRAELRQNLLDALGFESGKKFTPARTLFQLRSSIINRMGFIDPLTVTPRTLKQIRDALIDRMGYIDPLTVAPPRTLFQLRSAIIARLGLAMALAANTDSFDAIKTDVYVAMGYSSQAVSPPGVDALLQTWIETAQSTLMARIELDWKGAPRPSSFASGDQSKVDGTAIRLLAIAYGKAHDGSPDASGWMQQVEKYLADQMQRLPPNIMGQINAALIEANLVIYRRYELGQIGNTAGPLPFGASLVTGGDYSVITGAAETTVPQVDDSLVEMLALAMFKEKIGHPDAKSQYAMYEQAFIDLAKRSPPGMIAQLNVAIIEAHNTIFRRFELDQIGAVTMTFGAALIADISGDYSKTVSDANPSQVDDSIVELLALALLKDKISGPDAKALYAQYEQAINDLYKRSPPNLVGIVNATTIGAHRTVIRRFEVESTITDITFGIELDALGNYRGDESDNDPTQCDDNAVELLALAQLKERFGHPDAKVALAQYEQYMGDLLKSAPTGIVATINAALLSAHETIFRRYVVGIVGVTAHSQTFYSTKDRFTKDSDIPVVDDQAVYLLAMANLEQKFGIASYKQSRADFETYMDDLFHRYPPNAQRVIDSALKQVQHQLFRQYSLFRNKYWFTWTLVAGQRFYGSFDSDGAQSVAPSVVTAVIGTLVTPNDQMVHKRARSATALLPDGKPFLSGGTDSEFVYWKNAETFDPAVGKWSQTPGDPIIRRDGPQGELLLNGNVLIVGGYSGKFEASCELYNYLDGTFSPAASMVHPRDLFTSERLLNGKVLAMGGRGPPVGTDPQYSTHASAELYDPTTNTWTATPDMKSPRLQHASCRLANGTVLVVFGLGAYGSSYVATSEIYDPIKNIWTLTAGSPLTPARYEIQLVALADGRALLCGGSVASTIYGNTNIFDPLTGTWSAAGAMLTARTGHTAITLDSGLVLVVGGNTTAGQVTTLERFNPGTGTWSLTANILPTPSNFTLNYPMLIKMDDGKVLICGGTANYTGGQLSQPWAYIYDPVTDKVTEVGSQTAGSTYYRVVAATVNGSSLPSIEAVVSLVPAHTSVKVSWVPFPGQPFVRWFDIYRGKTTNTEQFIARVPVTQTSYIDEGTIPANGLMPTENNTQGPGTLDVRKIEWVGISQDNVSWRPLVIGVPPTTYNNNQEGIPQFCEIRNAIELWPTPAMTGWKLRIKGMFAPFVFESDTDYTTLDWQAIWFYAVAECKATFKRLDGRPLFSQIDIANAQAKADEYLGNLVAGQHMGERYIPGEPIRRNEVQPILLPLPGP